MWPIVCFAVFALVVPALSTYLGSFGDDDALAASFAEQLAPLGTETIRADKLEVLYRSRTSHEKDACDASWICRAPNGEFLLAIAQGKQAWGKMVVAWTWRRLTEDRARQAIAHDEDAYRAAFGESPRRF